MVSADAEAKALFIQCTSIPTGFLIKFSEWYAKYLILNERLIRVKSYQLCDTLVDKN